MRLRSVLLVTSAILATLATVTALSLIVLTGALHGAAAALRESTTSIAVAERFESTLALHARAPTGPLRASLEENLRSDAAETRLHVSGHREGQLVDTLNQRLGAYLAATARGDQVEGTRLFDGLLGAARELARMNLEQSQDLQRKTDRWDSLANTIGLSVAGLLFGGTLLLSLWLRSNLFRPILLLRAAIEGFASGDRRTRAKERGPVELREIAQRFNELVEKLSEHEMRQLVFMAGVVHDLRNPLSTVGLALARMDPARSRLGEDDVARLLSVLKTQVTRMDHLLCDLLDRAQIEAGELSLRPEPQDVAEIVGESVELYRAASPLHPVELASSGRPTACCDRARLSQVINNLLSNAIKYSPAGGPVRVELRQVCEVVEIAVSDRGIGISRDDLGRIFEPFRRGAGARHVAPGAGLGLHAARRIVEAHGGSLEVESSRGRGSTFRVRLPRHFEGPVSSTAVPAPTRPRPSNGAPN